MPVDVHASGAVVVDAVPVAGERAPADGRSRTFEHGQGAGSVLGVILRPAQHPDVVDPRLAMLPTKRQFSMAARLPWRRSKAESGYLRAVAAEDAIAEEHRLLHLSEMFNRHAGAARARVVPVISTCSIVGYDLA